MKNILRTLTTFLGVTRSVAQESTTSRLVMYYDQWHPNVPMTSGSLQGVTNVILAFMLSHNLNNATIDWNTFTYIEPGHKWHADTLKAIKGVDPKIKVSLAIGGWNDDPTTGWRAAIASDMSLSTFASNAKQIVTHDFGSGAVFDGVDIDWEYPGGNDVDYKSGGQQGSITEVGGYIKMLSGIKAAIGSDKLLSIATPGKKGDMLVFNEQYAKDIFASVDFVNIMSYDMMNRRDTVTSHHTSVADSLDAVKAYLDIGLDPAKANLGLALYAKWFGVNPGCTKEGGLGCATVLLEASNGADTNHSGSMTFESKNTKVAPSSLAPAVDGQCGPEKGMQCAAPYCCSTDGWCGDTADYCGYGHCNPTYSSPGSACEGPDVWKSWRTATSKPYDDASKGGLTYLDTELNIFWSWDSKDYVEEKFKQIVGPNKLGGVMAWSFGEENWDSPDHLNAMRAGIAGASGGPGVDSVPLGSAVPAAPDKPAPLASSVVNGGAPAPSGAPGVFVPGVSPVASTLVTSLVFQYGIPALPSPVEKTLVNYGGYHSIANSGTPTLMELPPATVTPVPSAEVVVGGAADAATVTVTITKTYLEQCSAA